MPQVVCHRLESHCNSQAGTSPHWDRNQHVLKSIICKIKTMNKIVLLGYTNIANVFNNAQSKNEWTVI